MIFHGVKYVGYVEVKSQRENFKIQFNVSSYQDKISDRSKKKGRIERCENSRGKGTYTIGR